MDVTQTPLSATYTLDAQATPAGLYQFLKLQPGTGHVTMEFRLPQGMGGQKIPVVRVVYVGEREVLTDDSRAALVGKLREWNDELIDKPGGSDAARILNNLVGTGNDLSLDVQELAPALAPMRDAHHAAHPNSYVKAWRENEQKVMEVVVPNEKGRAAEKIEKDQLALRFTLKVLSRFADVDSMENDGYAVQEQAWTIGHDLSPSEHVLLQIAQTCLTKPNASLVGIISGELLLLLTLCRQAQGKTLTQFKSDNQIKQTVAQLMDAMKKAGSARPELPDSPYARSLHARSGATSQPMMANSGPHKGSKTHQRRGSMPLVLLTKDPKLTGSTRSEAKNPADDRASTVVPKSPRSSGLPASAGSQTVKGKAKNDRPKLRRIRTDTEDGQPGGAAAAAPSSSVLVMPRQPSDATTISTSNTAEKTERRKRRLDRSDTASQARRDKDEDDAPQPLGRDSHEKKSSAKSSRSGKASKSGKSSKASSKESSPEDRDKPARSKPRKTRREHSGDSVLVTHQAASSMASVLTTSSTKSAKVEAGERVPRSRRAPRISQPEHMELQQLFASDKFRRAREELEQLPSYKPVQSVVYAAREDGPHYTEWGAFASDNQDKVTDEVFNATSTLLSYLHEPPADVNALKDMVRGVLRTLRFERAKMLLVLKARNLLDADEAALEKYETLRQTRDLLSLVLEMDNTRRIRNGREPLFERKTQ
ncbi:hypothetical protein [Noviherbaspirillum pedocola]|uniref:Uncharacterized protein n=1 Tax=Noviherbaspirillum pedocola TaxID=2801341 RepID=A0A934VZN6_9BURK|nr:hypothetical protein [Noviherbaspirillum pedocola]MBK4733211.1 hypothetical protein [Noviherbaspirillum pedocola]